MSARTPTFHLLLLSADQELEAHLLHHLKHVAVTVASDSSSLPRAAAKRVYDGVLVETKRGQLQDLTPIQRAIDPGRTFILAGSRSMLRQSPGMIQSVLSVNGRVPAAVNGDMPLDEYIKSKLSLFVKDMKNGSARNLHPMLIRAMEEPLITQVLQETNGNQIQAADMLGMNRNTLRKKIREFRIAVTRERKRARS